MCERKICQHKSIGAQILNLSKLPVSVVYEIQSFIGQLYKGSKWVIRCDGVSYSHFDNIDHLAVILHPQYPATSSCLDKTWFLQTRSDYMPGFKKDQTTSCNSCNVCQEDYWLFNERSSTMMLAFELGLFSCWLQKRAMQPFLRQHVVMNVSVALFGPRMFECLFFIEQSKHLVFRKVLIFTQLTFNTYYLLVSMFFVACYYCNVPKVEMDEVPLYSNWSDKTSTSGRMAATSGCGSHLMLLPFLL